ncbi:1790_t:CDS:2, partial [Gigaspora margarita]
NMETYNNSCETISNCYQNRIDIEIDEFDKFVMDKKNNDEGIDQDIGKEQCIDYCYKNRNKAMSDKQSGKDKNRIKQWIKANCDGMLIEKMFALYNSKDRYQCNMYYDTK